MDRKAHNLKPRACARGFFVVFANQGATNYFIVLEVQIIVVIVVKVVFGGVEGVAVGSAA